MKKFIIFSFGFIFLSAIIMHGDGVVENILISRGYTKYNPKELFVLDIYRDTYNEIFNRDYRFEKTGVETINLVIVNDFEYRLYYILEKRELPNLLSIIFLDTNEGVIGFYKKNTLLIGVKIQSVIDDLIGTGFEKDRLVFF
ncbi:MAG: hypothetical protein LBP20_09295 [Treponema sp.]|jgi:hypothetical protein|nr:hypothetical protein [Treponema sp.]